MLRFRISWALLALAAGAPLAADESRVRWVKLEEAAGRASVDGKPTVVFCVTDLLVDGPPVKGMDRAFDSEAVKAYRNEFHFVKCSDLKTVKLVRAVSKCELIVLDPEMADVHRVVLKGPADVAPALKAALAAYARKPISWATDAPPVESGKQMTVLLFASDSDADVAVVGALEDRRVASLHEKCVFVRITYRKDSPESKDWNVSQAPTLLLLDSTRDFKAKSVLDRALGKKNPREMRSFLAKGLAAIEKARK